MKDPIEKFGVSTSIGPDWDISPEDMTKINCVCYYPHSGDDYHKGTYSLSYHVPGLGIKYKQKIFYRRCGDDKSLISEWGLRSEIIPLLANITGQVFRRVTLAHDLVMWYSDDLIKKHESMGSKTEIV